MYSDSVISVLGDQCIVRPVYSVTSVTPVAGVVTMCDSCDRRHAAAEARKPDTGAYSHVETVDRRRIVQ